MSHPDAVDEVEFLKSRGSIVPIELEEELSKLKPVSVFFKQFFMVYIYTTIFGPPLFSFFHENK